MKKMNSHVLGFGLKTSLTKKEKEALDCMMPGEVFLKKDSKVGSLIVAKFPSKANDLEFVDYIVRKVLAYSLKHSLKDIVISGEEFEAHRYEMGAVSSLISKIVLAFTSTFKDFSVNAEVCLEENTSYDLSKFKYDSNSFVAEKIPSAY